MTISMMASPAVAEDTAKKGQENACHVHEKMVISGSNNNIIVSDPTMINKQITNKGVVAE